MHFRQVQYLFTHMKKTLFFLAGAALLISAAACSSPEKMTKQAENIKIECVPPVLEVIAGTIDATVSVTYPKGYYNPGVVMEVTPVIVYEGGEASMKPFNRTKIRNRTFKFNKRAGSVRRRHFRNGS